MASPIAAIAIPDPALVVTFRGQLGVANAATNVPMYKKASDGKYYLLDTTVTVETAGENGVAISLEKGQIDEYVNFIASGKVIAEGSFTQGHTYVGGAAGAIEIDSLADSSNWYKTHLFHAGAVSGSNTVLFIGPVATGVTA